MSKTINDLRDILFATMEDLRAGKIDVEKAKQIGNIGQVIVNSAVAEVRHLKEQGGSGTGFISEEKSDVKKIAREVTLSEHQKILNKYS